jgi:hypothetical protein
MKRHAGRLNPATTVIDRRIAKRVGSAKPGDRSEATDMTPTTARSRGITPAAGLSAAWDPKAQRPGIVAAASVLGRK